MTTFVTPRRCGVAVRLSHCIYIGIVNTCSKWNGSMSGVLFSGVCVDSVAWLSGLSNNSGWCV